MILNSPYISGSLTVTGNITSQGGITISGSITSASFATTSSFATTASYANTSTSASYALTASFATNATNFTASNILASNTITAQTLVVQTVTSSVIYSSGSNIFGNQLTNVQQMTGSVNITGSLSLNNIAIPTSASLASTYLPLAGGTLTGALSGTSATFSSTLLTGGDITVSKSGDSGLNLNSTTTNGVAVTRYKTTAAGNLWGTGINITAGDSRWEVYNFTLGASPFRISNAGVTTINGDGASLIYQAKTVNADLYLEMKNSAGTRRGYIGYGGASSALFEISNSENGAIDFRTNAAFAMRVTSEGNVEIGNASRNSFSYLSLVNDANTNGGVIAIARSAGQFLSSAGAGDMIIGNSTNENILFGNGQTGTTEYMRITSGGNVGIGTTSPTEKLHIYSSAGPELRMEGGAFSWYIRAYNDNFNVLTPTGRQAVSFLNNGDVRNYNNTTTWQQTSDVRVKENINTISDAMDKILSLNPVTFDYKQEFADKNNWDDNKKINNVGFIAQEFETIFPKYISTNKYEMTETIIDDLKSIDTGHLVTYLVKAIQEQQAQIQELTTRLTALESR